MSQTTVPLWLQTFDRLLPAATQFVLHGNVDDLWRLSVDADTQPHLQSTVQAIQQLLAASGYEFVVRWSPVDSRLEVVDGGSVDAAMELLDQQLPAEVSRERLRDVAHRLTTAPDRRGALVVDLASRLVTAHDQPAQDESRFFAAFQQAAAVSRPAPPGNERATALYNPVVWLTHRDTDLPSWFLAETPGVRSLALDHPDLEERSAIAWLLGPSAPGWDDSDPATQQEFVVTLADASDGLASRDLMRIIPMMIDQQLALDDVEDAVVAFRVGVLDNPWKRGTLQARIRDGEKRLRQRVLGQDRAVGKTLDVLKRSATGMTSAHRPGGARPRGVLFFAGPTGVGKTELAKATTELVFGDDSAMIRFDMSEFASEHTEARLIGAPPGYIGHDAGGELTSAVRTRPFCLLLLDEIEKAHPRILDKFLQILDDGRLTDSQGRTVDFRETLIVFTSNLGVYRDTPDGRELAVDPKQMTPEEIARTARMEITRHFTEVLGRPELLNRIGDNVMVFDFIDRETGQLILDRMLDNVIVAAREEQAVTLDLDAVRAELADRCLADLSFGGRGIGNVLEEAFVNPLARALFDHRLEGSTVTVRGLARDSDTTRVLLQ